MRTVLASRTVSASVHDAETWWYDTSRWSGWVDGLEHVVEVTGDWPRAGAMVTWQSGPAGRGRVTERVTAFEPLAGQTLEVADDAVSGHQTVSFTPDGEGTEISLSLDYQITQRSLFTPVVDALFIRRAMERSLSATLARFAAALAERR